MRRLNPKKSGADCGDAQDRVAAIYERYASNVAAYAVRRAGTCDAADAVAETFLIAWRRHDAVPQEPNTLPWLYGVTRRVLANQRRSRNRRGRLSNRLTAEFSARQLAGPPIDEREEFHRVVSAMKRLSEDDAELLRLTAWEALSPSEIAAAFGIPPGTARQRISRARQRLRKEMAADDAGLADQRRPEPLPGNPAEVETLVKRGSKTIQTIRGGVAP